MTVFGLALMLGGVSVLVGLWAHLSSGWAGTIRRRRRTARRWWWRMWVGQRWNRVARDHATTIASSGRRRRSSEWSARNRRSCARYRPDGPPPRAHDETTDP